MTLYIDIGWLLAVLLISVRIAAATAFAPVFGPTMIPAPVRVALAFALGAILVSITPARPALIGTPQLAQLIVAMLGETVIGLSFAFGLLAAYAATQIAGRALDVQVGFGAASVLNPAIRGLSPLIGSVLGMSMLVVFLSMDGHHLLLQALAASTTSIEPASLDSASLANLATRVVEHSSVMFAFALSLAAPVMFALWLADVAMSVFARSMPQLNVFLLSFAVKIVLGMVGLAMSIGITRRIFNGLNESLFRFWGSLGS
ncbi:MAG TPA: flagellar biosynthetic protein FliR [Steroidobacteraceae bacterium]|nr:flagellar biosynthetic protein FliR [Steroidobacteraceae bacterium]